MNKGFIFVFISGLILGALIVLLNIIELRREEILILSSGVLSLLGGAFGATGAYFIAKEQIKKQDSMRKMDWKLEKFESIIVCLNDMIKELEEFRKKISDARLKKTQYNSQDVEGHVKNIKSSYDEINKLSIYFRFIFIDTENIMLNLENEVILTVTKADEKHFDQQTEKRISENLEFLDALKKNLESSIENIILD